MLEKKILLNITPFILKNRSTLFKGAGVFVEDCREPVHGGLAAASLLPTSLPNTSHFLKIRRFFYQIGGGLLASAVPQSRTVKTRFTVKTYGLIFAIFGFIVLGWQPFAYAQASNLAIASAHPLATQAGRDVIDQGGNAFDAAVAVSAALAVVEPSGSGLGGGGFWLLHRARDGFETMLDGREKAPLAAHKAMFLNKDSKVILGLSITGALSAGIPGVPAALAHLAEHYGQLPLSESLKPAIRYAREGFPVGDKYRKLVTFRLKELQTSETAAAIFLDGGQVPKKGWILKQPELAYTLERLAQFGRDGFYSGVVAEKLLQSVKSSGGIWQQEDLNNYRVIERAPVRGRFHGLRITSASLPSSGGIGLIESLNILSEYDLAKPDSTTRKHLIVEAMRRSYRDRAMYLGDPDFIDVPVARLINPDYAAGLRVSLRPDKALASSLLAGEMSGQSGGDNTTHFSIMDTEGNRVAATLSINYPFGAAFVADGTGVLLNDEMDDFVSLPGAMNVYGLVGGAANAIEPGKRMLSSMAPSFVEDEHKVAVIGTPGGSRIISMVLLAVLDIAEGKGPQSWVSVPRFHHQYLPDVIQYEAGGLSLTEIEGLTRLGHAVKQAPYQYGDMQVVQFDKATRQFDAASDPRGEGLSLTRNE
ncbi:gamma-glutamyltransferase [Methylicorpusculum oleiharenae]|uniref:gamma-glutamyltransferase n=1 Tax=Methylicorpusculum oleiharenae TaxID=1338687 RepID=UPI00135B4074|nr:gamma-glutamyltransferase [Methylicorpusculum oleiharenae]MCD2450046.1 gamma-glutamyltransferase [Methylicorpusculum oleiharenae]